MEQMLQEETDLVPDAPKVNGGKGFWKSLLRTILGISISIILTFGTNVLITHRHRVQDRKLTTMMVLSNIESFARTLETRSDKLALNDSIAAWLLNTPIEDLELMPEKELSSLISRALSHATLNHDRAAESVFTNNIETWKNVGNVHFVDHVGACFSALNGVEEQFNKWVTGVSEATHDVSINPDHYEGSTVNMKYLHSDRIRAAMADVHNRRCWLRYAADCLRYYNRINMASIGITEQEVMDYTNTREQHDFNVGNPPDAEQYYTDPFTLDSLPSMTRYSARIEELKAGKP
jgi:hypothetical protein